MVDVCRRFGVYGSEFRKALSWVRCCVCCTLQICWTSLPVSVSLQHSYADDTQVYVGTPAADAHSAVRRFADCVDRVSDWMAANRLKLNADKTQVIWIGTRQQLTKIDIEQVNLRSATIPFSSAVRNLGVTVDNQLNMAEHISSLRRSCFFQLRQLRTIRLSLTFDATRTLVQAFVSSRLDYCNSLLYGVTDHNMRQLQSIQNAAARLVTGSRKYDRITPVLRDLHWLPVRERITFKIATLVYKCLHGLAPPYLAEHCIECIPVSAIAGLRHLRSADSQTLYVPSSQTVTGKRSFAYCGPSVWNSLPAHLRLCDFSLATFRRKLKSYLFGV